MSKTIIMKLQGGLGNQMFQYAFGRALQCKIGAKLVLDTSDFKYDKAGRKYALEPFNIPKDIIIDSSGKYNIKYDQRKNWIIKFGVKFCPMLMYNILSKLGIYIWEDIKFNDVKVDENRETVYVHGLWQSEKYFGHIQTKIKNELQVKSTLSTIDMKLINNMQKENSVCVHVRRGDFLNSNNKLYNCTNEYYEQAMKCIEEKISNPCYYIFSDDIEEVKEKFNFNKRKVVFINGKRSDYEEFRLMYNCKSFITANSTFSWWASYLGSDGKNVVTPKQWYTDETDISNLIREEMICV